MFDQYSGLPLGHTSHGLEITLIVCVIRTCSFSPLDKLVGRNPTGIKAKIHNFLRRKEARSLFLIVVRVFARRSHSLLMRRPGQINVAL